MIYEQMQMDGVYDPVPINEYSLSKILERVQNNQHIYDSFIKTSQVMQTHKNITCNVSGGSDSDIMLDLMYHLDQEKRLYYIWFNTGLEYQATKNHLKFLEQMISTKNLKRCPFCGGFAACYSLGDMWFVECQNYCTGRHQVRIGHTDRSAAVNLWNDQNGAITGTTGVNK